MPTNKVVNGRRKLRIRVLRGNFRMLFWWALDIGSGMGVVGLGCAVWVK